MLRMMEPCWPPEDAGASSWGTAPSVSLASGPEAPGLATWCVKLTSPALLLASAPELLPGPGLTWSACRFVRQS